MVKAMLNVRDIFDHWPSRAALADDIGVTPQAITNMIARNSIPSRYWQRIIAAAARRSISGVTFESLSLAIQERAA